MADLDPELCNCFLDEAKELLEGAERCFLDLEKADRGPAVFDHMLRLAHNLKGSAGAVGFDGLSKFTHKLESVLLRLKNGECSSHQKLISLLLECGDFLNGAVALLRQNLFAKVTNEELSLRLESIINCKICEKLKSGPPDAPQAGPCGFVHPVLDEEQFLEGERRVADVQKSRWTVSKSKEPERDDSIRVGLERIDRLMNNVGELVILQTGLSQTRHLLQSAVQFETVSQMDKIIREVQEITMALRLVPLSQTFQKMRRIVRDTSQAVLKEVEFEVSGEDIELDKNVVEQLSDPLVHLLRNAVDHGLEPTEERIRSGKSRQGHVFLGAYHSGGRVVIEVRDDGKGLDPRRLIAKAREKRLLSDEDRPTDEQAYQLIFAPGFSTKEEVTSTSGRGVGMDVVKTNIAALQGDVAIETTLGLGTTFRITLPLTLAIIDGIVVKLGTERYVLPLVQVSETVQIETGQISKIGETGQVLRLRNENIPVCGLEIMLGHANRQRPPMRSVGIIVHDELNSPHCMLVDQIVGQQQVVIKRLGHEVHWLAGLMGAAILADGEAVLILDVQDLLRRRAESQKCEQRNKQREAV